MGVWLSPAADIDRLEWQVKDPSLSKHPRLRGNEKCHLSVNSLRESQISASNHRLTVKNWLFAVLVCVCVCVCGKLQIQKYAQR